MDTIHSARDMFRGKFGALVRYNVKPLVEAGVCMRGVESKLNISPVGFYCIGGIIPGSAYS